MLITLARAREESKLVGLSDAELTRRIEDAQERIERYCRRQFELQSHTETYYDDDVYDDRPIMGISLKNFPVTQVETIVTVQYDGTETTYDAGSEDVPEDFRIRKQLGELWSYKRSFLGEVEITYTAGFATIPELIQEACVALCVHDLDIEAGQYQAESLGDRSYTIGKLAMEEGHILPNNVTRMVGSYRRIPV